MCAFVSWGFQFCFKIFVGVCRRMNCKYLFVADSGNPKENQFVGSRILGENVSERRRGVSFLCLMRMVGSLLYCLLWASFRGSGGGAFDVVVFVVFLV